MNAPFAPAPEETVDLGELNRSVGFMLRMTQVRAYAQFFRAFAETDVRPGEFTVLWVLAQNPGLRQGTLARTLMIKPAHMTKLVQRLVDEGFVTRTVPPEDRRAVNLTLTDAGAAHIERHQALFNSVHSPANVGLTDREYAQLLTLLGKMTFKDLPECP